MRQKVLAVLFAITVGIIAAGCSGDISTTAEETASTVSEDVPIIEQERCIEDSVVIVADDEIDSTVDSDTKEFEENESIDGEAKELILAGFFAFDDSSYIIFSINPVTGDYKEISRFPYDVNAWIGNVGDIVPAGIPEYRFSSDFTKMAAQMTVINTENDIHEIHAGWMDVNGNFYDVKKVTGDEFCSEPLGFTENNLFVYDFYSGAHDYHYIEIDNPSVSYAGNPFAEREFNILNTSTGGDIPILIYDNYRQTDILEDALWIVDGSGESKYYNPFTNEFLDYLPEDLGDFHRVKNGRLNPEHNAIAILVQSRSPSEGYNIYILSIDENGNFVDNSLERVPFDLIRNTNRDDYVLLRL